MCFGELAIFCNSNNASKIEVIFCSQLRSHNTYVFGVNAAAYLLLQSNNNELGSDYCFVKLFNWIENAKPDWRIIQILIFNDTRPIAFNRYQIFAYVLNS